MTYGVVAPGISGVYEDFEYVKRIQTLYPYCKFRKFKTEKEALEFIKRNENKHDFTELNHYGDTFDKMFVRVEYFITEDSILYNVDTHRVGHIKLLSEDAIIDNRNGLSMVKICNISLNPNMISSHMIAIYHILKILGNYLDADIIVNNHAVFYALMSYSGKNRVIKRTTDLIKSRLGNMSITLRIEGDKEDEE